MPLNVISPLVIISIHALREEGDVPMVVRSCSASLFLSTPSARRATNKTKTIRLGKRHFYPRPPRGGRLSRSGGFVPNAYISIHALREEGDHQSD